MSEKITLTFGPGWSSDAMTGTAIRDISVERERQIEKGWTRDHDDAHGIGHIINEVDHRLAPDDRPWDRATLVKCAAMLVAAIETYDRATSSGSETGS